MKTGIFWGIMFFLLAVGIYSCSSEQDPVNNKKQKQIDVSFNIGLNDFSSSQTRADEENDTLNIGNCKSMDELMSMAAAGNLYAEITLGGEQPTTIRLLIHSLANNTLNTETYPFYIDDEQVQSCYTITNVLIRKKEGETPNADSDSILYSGVKKNAHYSSYIPQDYLLDYEFCLNKEEHAYKKTTFNLYVLCAVNQNAELFGFAKWNLHFVNTYCFPIMVNHCTNLLGDYQPDSIVVEISYMISTEKPALNNPNWTELVNSQTSYIVPGTPGMFCFKDDLGVADSTEWHKINMTWKTTPVHYTATKIVNNKTLRKDFGLNNDGQYAKEWNKDFNFMHINFCGTEEDGFWGFVLEGFEFD